MSIEEIFLGAIEKQSALERQYFLEEAFAQHPNLRVEVEALLRSHDSAGTFLSQPIVDPIGSRAGSPIGSTFPELDVYAGKQIGPFHIVERIGRGGMGLVYLAEQTDLAQRQVAIKVVRPELATKSMLARFEAERRALAIMDHPNIAKVLDSGQTEFGHPYFVMELVRGVPITTYCDKARFNPLQRLELMVSVCNAVQHAHQKGIIHRDIKPSNVLVTEFDGKPVPKIIDFGIAKAIDAKLSEQSLHTDFGAVVGTLEYMSPEQAGLEPQDVDTRSDVYSLGVLMYELLTGSTPIDRTQMESVAFIELLRTIREVDPPRPSTRISSTDNAPSVAANRSIEPARLQGFVRGELDWIAMRAIEKDRDRRYQSANDLSQEIQRFLQHEPVHAGPPTVRYRLSKFLRRNRTASIALGLVLFSILAGSVATTLGWLESRRQYALAVVAEGKEREARKLAEQRLSEAEAAREKEKEARETSDAIANFMSETLGRPSPGVDGRTVTIVDAFSRSVDKLNNDFAERPLIRAKLLHAIGWTYLKLGLYQEAVGVLAKSFDVYQDRFGARDKVAAGLLTDLSTAYWSSGNVKKAIELGEQSIAIREAIPDAAPHDQTSAKVQLATAYKLAGNLKKAIELQESCFAEYENRLGPRHFSTLSCLSDLASCYSASGKLSDAKAAYEKARAAYMETVGLENPDTLRVSNNLGSVLNNLGKPAEAISMLEETLVLRRKILGDMHAHTTSTVNNLANSYILSNQLEKATLLYQTNLETRMKALGPNHIQTLKAMNNLGGALFSSGKTDEGIKLLEDAIAIGDANDFGKNADIMALRTALVQMCSMTKQTDKAFALCRSTLEIQTVALGEDHPFTMHTLHAMGMIQIDRKELVDAIASLSTVFANRKKKLGADHEDTLLSMQGLARALGKNGHSLEAEKLFTEALAIRTRKSEEDWRTFSLMAEFGEFCFDQNRHEAAESNLLDGYEGMLRNWKAIPHESRGSVEAARKKLVELYSVTNRPELATKYIRQDP